jgi:hypothetical protein
MLLAMATFRTPLIALMPDITPSPLRSKANGVINLMGGIGALLAAFGGAALYSLNKVAPFDKLPSASLGTGRTGTCLVEQLLGRRVRQVSGISADYHTQDFVEVIRQAEPNGLDAVFDGMVWDYLDRGFSLLRRGGTWVQYGNPLSFSGLLRLLTELVLLNVLPNGRSLKLYGTTTSKLGRCRYLEDWTTLFKLLEEGKIKPVILEKFPILEAAQANALLESGQVTGNVVLLAPEFL